MKKLRNPLIFLAFAATAVCGLAFAAKAAPKDVVTTFATYINHDAQTYYDGISDSLTGDSLLSALRSLNSTKRKTTVGYSGMGTSPSGQFKYTDYDPATVKYDENGQPYGTKLITFYSGKSVTSGLNREHVWPKSHGGNSVEGDIHMPRPTLEAENGSRGNSFYVEGKCDQNNGWDPAMEDFGIESYRGDSARIIFYCVVAESRLSLLEADSHPTSNSNRDNLMGKLSDLIKWHLKYPVQQREQNRNEGAEYLQGNRNPFIDHRSYACKIWGNANSTTKSLCDQYNGWTDGEEQVKDLTNLTVSGSPTKTTYNVGDTFVPNGITVTATYSDGSTDNVTSQVSWSVLALGDTSTTGTYTYKGKSLTVTVSGLTVKNQGIPTTSVKISVPILSLNKGQTEQLSCAVYPDDATNKNVSWSSSDPEVASVSGNGLVTALKSGQTTITVTTENGGFTDSCAVTVKSEGQAEKVMVGIDVVEKPTKLSYHIGETFSTEGMEILALYNDGTSEDITYKATLETPSLTSEGTKVVKVSYKTFETSFSVLVLTNTVESLISSKSPAKLHYQMDEPLNPYGAVIKANMTDGTSIANVASLCSYEYDFSVNNAVTASFGGKSVVFYVFVDLEEATLEHEAAEFAYSFNEKLDNIDAKEVSKQQWDSMEYYYNQLDDEAKAYLKTVSSTTGKGEVSAEVPNQEALKQCARKYDETYLAHKDEGFVDFIGRDPQPITPANNDGLLILIGVGAGVFVLIVIIVVVAVSVSKKDKKKYA